MVTWNINGTVESNRIDNRMSFGHGPDETGVFIHLDK